MSFPSEDERHLFIFHFQYHIYNKQQPNEINTPLANMLSS